MSIGEAQTITDLQIVVELMEQRLSYMAENDPYRRDMQLQIDIRKTRLERMRG